MDMTLTVLKTLGYLRATLSKPLNPRLIMSTRKQHVGKERKMGDVSYFPFIKRLPKFSSADLEEILAQMAHFLPLPSTKSCQNRAML